MNIPKKFIIQIVIVLIEWNWFNKFSCGYTFTTTEYYNGLNSENNINNSLEYYDFDNDENLTTILMDDLDNNKVVDGEKNVKIKRSKTTGIVKTDEFRYFNVGILMASHLGEFFFFVVFVKQLFFF